MRRNINLVPMAGAGQRFADAGYTQPKPLIPVDGAPMIVQAARCFPPADEWIFLCRTEHVRTHHIDATLAAQFAPAHIVPVDVLTEGQACTCLLAAPWLRPDDQLFIGPCDNAMTYDRAQYAEYVADPAIDAFIWTFRRNPAVLKDPRMYGWVATDGATRALRVSCKVPISASPTADHAIIGAFSFRRAADFIAMTQRLIAANRRINNEFYMDEVMNVAIEAGLNVRVFEVCHYICWGTPADLDVYHYWQGYFRLANAAGCAAGQPSAAAPDAGTPGTPA